MTKKRLTSDAVKILHARYIGNDPHRLKSLQQERQRADIAAQIYKLRTDAGVSQKRLAELIGTTQSVISRLEDADYRGHSIEMLRRIADALNCELRVRIVHHKKPYARTA